MKSIKIFISIIFFSLVIISCGNQDNSNIVNVVAKDYYFESPDSIASGWTTFNLKNEGTCVHFFYLTFLPGGATFQMYLKDIGGAFAISWDSLQAGMDKASAGALLGSLLPKWYASAKAMGGVGLISPGKTAQTTIKLVPGNYVMECYMKTKDGKFHSELGMIKPLTVTDKVSKMKEPTNANVDVSLSNYKIESNGKLSAGKNRIAVHFKEHPKYGLGNDVHIVKLNDNTNIDRLTKWMDWMNIDGLRTPAPAEFLGGVQEMPVGFTAYFTVDLKPGNYAFISESPVANKMFERFTIN